MPYDAGIASDELRIRRLAAHYLVSTRHPAPHKVASALDTLCARQLPAALNRQVVEPMHSADADEGIWLIKKLVTAVDLDLGLDGDVQARRWAGQIARELARTLDDPDAGVVFFASRSAWRARLILDIARGEAWDHWYHRGFAGIKALPASAAIRTVLTDESGDPALILAELLEEERTEVIRSLGELEARRVLDHWLVEPVPESAFGQAASCIERLLNKWVDVPSQLDKSPALLALWLLASTAETWSSSFPKSLIVIAESLILIDRMGPRDAAVALDALNTGDVANLWRTIPERADLWQNLAAMPQQVRRQLRSHCSSKIQDSDRGVEVTDTGQNRQTPYGGWFFLLPQLEATLPWSEMADWPELQGTPASKVLRWLVLAHCEGSRSFTAAVEDGFWRDSFGIDPNMSPEILEIWINDIEPERWRRLQQLVVSQELNMLGNPMVLGIKRNGDTLAILANGTSRHWIDARRLNGEKLSQVVKVLYRDSMANGVGRNHQTIKVNGFDNDAEAEAAWLDISGEMNVASDASLVLLLASQRVLRKFARRIPGFSGASFQHLHSNVLDVGASVDAEDERTLVRVSRPPLDVMLNMTGINRSRPVVPWWNGPPLEIYPNDQ